jgi:type IV secretion system protein VirB10
MTEPDADRALAAARAGSAPRVAQPPNRWLLPLGAIGIAVLGIATFAALQRPETPKDATAAIGSTPPSNSASLPPPPVLAPATPVMSEPAVNPTIAPPAPPPAPAVPPVAEPARPQTAPAMIVDNSAAERAPAAADAAKVGTIAAADKLSSNEGFADRLARTTPESIGTDKLSSTDLVIPQGTVITAVLETAINSDLPGLVRAVVSRDVTGFDGSKVLIPRGSRLVGQYSSGVALGQSRAFVIWTRVLRSDGVSVQLTSAATDTLGTAGLGGKVDSHFMKRFGAATLLSVITGGIEFLANSAGGGSQVLVGNSSQANQLASIALQRQIDIAPTIKVAQGTPVRVFVARDLDFGMTREKKP